MKKEITINNHIISPEHPVYIIAEMSANHGKNLEHAIQTIHAMKESGADAVKLQTYTPDTMTIDCDREEFKIGKGTIWEGKTLYELYKEAAMPWEWQPKLKKIANELDMDLFSTPFDSTSVDFLEDMEIPAYKIASFELVDIPLITYVASKNKPMILSTGMASKEEIEDAIAAVRSTGNVQVALLKCTSAYPASPKEMNLHTIPDMAARFQVPIGLSDHTLGTEAPVAAVSLGACIIEKHFTLSRSDQGPDSTFSLEPNEFRTMVDAVRAAETGTPSGKIDEEIMGTVQYGPSSSEKASAIFRRSLFVVEDIPKGGILTPQNIRSIRPGYGLPPKELDAVIGKKAKYAINRGTPLLWELLE
ncbi:MAG: pseudaminic acid synthase [Candidatus Peribacteraceae bacterium]|jgi:N-acetylneuraminate synthase